MTKTSANFQSHRGKKKSEHGLLYRLHTLLIELPHDRNVNGKCKTKTNMT